MQKATSNMKPRLKGHKPKRRSTSLLYAAVKIMALGLILSMTFNTIINHKANAINPDYIIPYNIEYGPAYGYAGQANLDLYTYDHTDQYYQLWSGSWVSPAGNPTDDTTYNATYGQTSVSLQLNSMLFARYTLLTGYPPTETLFPTDGDPAFSGQTYMSSAYKICDGSYASCDGGSAPSASVGSLSSNISDQTTLVNGSLSTRYWVGSTIPFTYYPPGGQFTSSIAATITMWISNINSFPANPPGTQYLCVSTDQPVANSYDYPACPPFPASFNIYFNVPSCPSGYSGTYPNCVPPPCPSGEIGTYPNCVPPPCPSGEIGTYPNCEQPPPASNKPYLQVTGGDTIVGSGFGEGCTDNQLANISAWNSTSPAYTNGAGGQFAVMALGPINGFPSAQGLGTAGTGLSFANTVNNNPAGGGFGGNFSALPPCATDYYGGMPTTGITALPATDTSPSYLSQGGVYSIGSDSSPAYIDLAPSSAITMNSGQQTVLYVDGDVNIENNITYAALNPTSLKDVSLFELIVKGNITIAPNVTTLDGIYIAEPNSASAYQTSHTVAYNKSKQKNNLASVKLIPSATKAHSATLASISPFTMSITGTTSNSVTVAWTTAQPDPGESVGYALIVTGPGNPSNSGGTSPTTATGLQCNTTYTFQVEAVEFGVNFSGYQQSYSSNGPLNATTGSCAPPPSAGDYDTKFSAAGSKEGGVIYTCWDATLTTNSYTSPDCYNNRLTINGAVAASTVKFWRTGGNVNSPGAAETFNYSPLVWLAQPATGSNSNSQTPDAILTLPPVL